MLTNCQKKLCHRLTVMDTTLHTVYRAALRRTTAASASGTASSFKAIRGYSANARKGRPKELVVHFNSFRMNDFLALLKFSA